MHIPRLAQVWSPNPTIFITTCTAGRKALLNDPKVVGVLREEWHGFRRRNGWAVGRYVVMPDHVHFFVCPYAEVRRSLSTAIGKWKEWTSRRIVGIVGTSPPVWQAAFFDRVMRHEKEGAEMWNYVRENPVRAGLVRNAGDWPYAGAIDFETARSGPTSHPF